MRIKITFDIGERERRAVAEYYGVTGLASYDDMRGFIVSSVANLFPDMAGYNDETPSDDVEAVTT